MPPVALETNPDGTLQGTQNSPLPPSVEAAYYSKCIALKRRINEVEEANDAARLRKIRINRQIMKMRLERAFLLEQIQKRMSYNVDESDDSTEPPTTPQDRPLRSKRAHGRKNTPPPTDAAPHHTPSSANPGGHSHDSHAEGYFDQAATPHSSAPHMTTPGNFPPQQESQPLHGIVQAASSFQGATAPNQGRNSNHAHNEPIDNAPQAGDVEAQSNQSTTNGFHTIQNESTSTVQQPQSHLSHGEASAPTASNGSGGDTQSEIVNITSDSDDDLTKDAQKKSARKKKTTNPAFHHGIGTPEGNGVAIGGGGTDMQMDWESSGSSGLKKAWDDELRGKIRRF